MKKVTIILSIVTVILATVAGGLVFKKKYWQFIREKSLEEIYAMSFEDCDVTIGEAIEILSEEDENFPSADTWYYFPDETVTFRIRQSMWTHDFFEATIDQETHDVRYEYYKCSDISDIPIENTNWFWCSGMDISLEYNLKTKEFVENSDETSSISYIECKNGEYYNVVLEECSPEVALYFLEEMCLFAEDLD